MKGIDDTREARRSTRTPRARGPKLVDALASALTSSGSPVGLPQPLDARGLRAAEDAAGVALSPAMAMLLQIDIAWMRRAFAWFDDEGRLRARPFAALVAEHARTSSRGFDDILARFAGHALPLDAGSDSARFLYLGDPDAYGEYPIVGIDHDDIPWMGVEVPGFDVWLARALEVPVRGVRADIDAAHRRLFGRKRAWSLDLPWRVTTPVAGPAPGTVTHARPQIALARGPSELDDEKLDAALMQRAADGDLPMLRRLLADATSRARPRAALDDALVAAVRWGRIDATRALLDAGASPMAHVRSTEALAIAVQHGVALVEVLLAAGARADAACANGRTALFTAIEQGAIDVVRVLLDAGATIEHAATNGLRPLHVAAESGATDAVRLLLERGADPDGGGQVGTPLLRAVDHPQERGAIVELLLAAGADPDRGCAYDDRRFAHLARRPLHTAFVFGHGEIARRLVRAGADPSARDGRGFSLEDVYDADGRDVIPVWLPSDEASGRLRCRIRLTVLDTSLLHRFGTPQLTLSHWVELASQGLAGPSATLAIVTEHTDGVSHEIAATLIADRVAPAFFDLFAATLRGLRGVMRVTGVWVEPEPPAACRAWHSDAPSIIAVQVPFSAQRTNGSPALAFTLARAIDATADSAQRAARAAHAFASAAAGWGGRPQGPFAGLPSVRRGKREVTIHVPLSAAGPDGMPLTILPWSTEPMLATLKAVALRMHADVPLASVSLSTGAHTEAQPR